MEPGFGGPLGDGAFAEAADEHSPAIDVAVSDQTDAQRLAFPSAGARRRRRLQLPSLPGRVSGTVVQD